jgi:hypothetical protein
MGFGFPDNPEFYSGKTLLRTKGNSFWGLYLSGIWAAPAALAPAAAAASGAAELATAAGATTAAFSSTLPLLAGRRLPK